MTNKQSRPYTSLVFLIILLLASCSGKESRTDQLPGERSLIVDRSVTARIDSTLKSFVASGTIAGVSALIYEKNEEVYYNAFGFADRNDSTQMERNTIVQIYSMTKPITGTALMTLYEEGAFQLDDPLEQYAPEFADMQVYRGVDDSGKMLLEPARRPITIRDITRHTAGFVNRSEIPVLGPLMVETDAMNRENTLAQVAEKMGGLPLWFHPGEQWEYGPSVDVQAYVVERISGVPFAQYVQEHILDPLGMDETRYFVPESDRNRMASVYHRSEDGVLIQIPDEEAHDFNINQWPLTPGGWGFTSTLDDYMRFARMLVNEGTLDSVTILQPETVQLMATNHLADSIEERSWLPSKGQVGFGIDFAVRLRPPATPEENNGVVGEFFWDGAASTLFWVDPVNELTAILFVQLFPFDQVGLHKQFRDAVYGPVE